MASLTNYKINDLDSFNAVTGDPHEVAGLYFYSVLDCLVDLAYKVSYDFFKRSYLYIDLGLTQHNPTESRPTEHNAGIGLTLSAILAKLHARYGSNEFLPSKAQRDEIDLPIFGRVAGYSTDEEGDFPRLRDELINACAAFAERVFDTGVEMLRERVRTTHRPFQEYLIGLQGDSVKWSRGFALPQLTEEVSYTILRNKGVAGVFGIDKPPRGSWPYTEDANGDKLVEAISKQLLWTDQPKDMCTTREQISNLQRVALRGAEAIATIIDFQETMGNGDLDLLITKCYTWGAALLSMSSHLKNTQPTSDAKESGLAVGYTTLQKAW
ncbi:MAG: hypothetical protein ACJ8AG_19905 [Ktedonobacteraceae bacterium]